MATDNRSSKLQSPLRTIWLVIGWMLVLLIIYLSLTPEPIEMPVEQGDKLSHVAAYLVLMSWFANVYEGTSQRITCAAGCIGSVWASNLRSAGPVIDLSNTPTWPPAPRA